MDVLVVGSGGREHALGWKLRQSPRCGRLLAAPGNPGLAAVGTCLPIGADDADALVQLAMEERVGLVVVGPEAPLAAGLADRLRSAGIPVFGPSAAAARIESSKAFARDLMTRMGIPQPEYAVFTHGGEAQSYLVGLAARGVTSVVVKASGLAAGKGAVVCETIAAAQQVTRAMLDEGAFGDAGREVVIEERLVGPEASLLVVTDGYVVVPCLPAQDYKRIGEEDTGPNTGGMGSYAPAPLVSGEVYAEALTTIVRPALRALAEAGTPFVGCLYAGLMLTAAGLKVIEFNCRFGDPETQAVLSLLDSDLLELLLAAAEGRLAASDTHWRPEKAVCVALVSAGYPGRYDTGMPITGLEEAQVLPGVTIFHAGTRRASDGALVTAGGRVLNVVGTGSSFACAMDRAYAAADCIRFAGKTLRRDIGLRVRE